MTPDLGGKRGVRNSFGPVCTREEKFSERIGGKAAKTLTLGLDLPGEPMVEKLCHDSEIAEITSSIGLLQSI